MTTHPLTEELHYATDLSLSYRAPSRLASRTTKGIFNAWLNAAVIDARGTIWVRKDKLHVILRTSTANASRRFQYAPDRYKRTAGKTRYLLASYVTGLIDEVIQTAGTHTRSLYAQYSEKVYHHIRDSELAINKRLIHWEHIRKTRSKLKAKRKRRWQIRHDELTGSPLSTRAEFSHIRSASLYYDIAEQPWNGLLVNKNTHDVITRRNVCDESELYNLCKTQGWYLDWYKPFIQELERYGLLH